MSVSTGDASLFYQSEHHEAIWRNFDSEKIIISFSPRKEPAPAEFFGQSFFEKEKISYVIVRTLDNSWYLQTDVDDLLASIRERIIESGAKIITLFGSSMGSFGCIRAANSLKPDKLIICAPVVTLDPAIERRWMSDYNHLLEEHERAAPSLIPFKTDIEVFAIYDPLDKDAQHVDILERSTPVTRIQIRGAGHMVLQYLRDSGTLGSVIRLLMGPSVNREDVSAILVRSRKQNKSHLLNLSERLDKRPRLQIAVLNYASERFPHDIDILLARAAYHSRQAQLPMACQIIENLASRHGRRCMGVALGKAVAAYARHGGRPDDIREAVALFEAPTPRPRGAQIWYSRFLRICKKWDEAFLSHQQFMGGDAFQAHAHIERGLIFEHHDLLCAARSEFEAAVQFAPEYPPGRQHLARMQRRMAKKGLS